jgi:hypothetical protein
MPAQIQRLANDTYVLRLSGLVKKSEFGNVQNKTAADINQGAKPRILAILENFEGWERGAEWGDLSFLFSHGNEIEKIAIVGEPRLEGEALAFAGAGFRRAPVKFFSTGQESQARTWLAE